MTIRSRVFSFKRSLNVWLVVQTSSKLKDWVNPGGTTHQSAADSSAQHRARSRAAAEAAAVQMSASHHASAVIDSGPVFFACRNRRTYPHQCPVSITSILYIGLPAQRLRRQRTDLTSHQYSWMIDLVYVSFATATTNTAWQFLSLSRRHSVTYIFAYANVCSRQHTGNESWWTQTKHETEVYFSYFQYIIASQ